jgi:hypothetical protein
MSFDNKINRQGSLISIRTISLILLLLFILSTTCTPIGGQHTGEQYIPEYARSISVNDHYILINQLSPTSLEIEELIWFNNFGIGNFSGNLFLWSQPHEILKNISQIGFVIDDTFYSSKLYPSSQSPNFLYLNITDDNLTIAPKEKLQVAFKYILNFQSAEEFKFSRIFLYNNSNLFVFIEPYEGYIVEGLENIELIYDENSRKRNW